MDRASVILVAEDDPVIRNLLNRVLTRAGYIALVACDGVEAVEISTRYSGPIDLLLSDVTMPRLGGIGLLRRLREERPELKALMISGRASSEMAQGNTSYDFLAKPFLPGDLTIRVEKMLAGGPRNPEVETI